MRPAVEAGVEGGSVETKGLRDRLQPVVAEGVLVLAVLIEVERVVVRPEGALVVGAGGSFGRSERLRADEGVVAELEARQPRRDVVGLQLRRDVPLEQAATGALEVAPLGRIVTGAVSCPITCPSTGMEAGRGAAATIGAPPARGRLRRISTRATTRATATAPPRIIAACDGPPAPRPLAAAPARLRRSARVAHGGSGPWRPCDWTGIGLWHLPAGLIDQPTTILLDEDQPRRLLLRRLAAATFGS